LRKKWLCFVGSQKKLNFLQFLLQNSHNFQHNLRSNLQIICPLCSKGRIAILFKGFYNKNKNLKKAMCNKNNKVENEKKCAQKTKKHATRNMAGHATLACRTPKHACAAVPVPSQHDTARYFVAYLAIAARYSSLPHATVPSQHATRT